MATFISERGINTHFYPIMGKVPPGDIIRKRNDEIIFIAKEGSRWDLNCFKVIDFLSTGFLAKFKEHCINKSGQICRSAYDPYLQSIPYLNQPDKVYKYSHEINNPGSSPDLRVYYSEITNTSSEILSKPFFRGIDNKTLKETLEKMSSYKIKCKYKFLSKNEGKTHNYKNCYNMINLKDFESIFNYEFIEGKEGKNGKKYGSKHKLTFNTTLSSLFIHHIYLGGYNLIKDLDKFYSLSKYANLLFRKRFLSWNRNFSTILKIDTVLSDLCLECKNPTVRKKKFVSIVEELADNNFISIQEKQNGSNNIPKYLTTRVKID